MAAWAQEADTAKFRAAGVCSRCHVAQVLEWTTSKHPNVNVACRDCHGASEGHVANERNQVKPDRLPHGAAIAGLCASCHTAGCPKTKEAAKCESCHHPHALIHPAPGKLTQMTFQDDDRVRKYDGHMRSGEASAAKSDWKGALAEFEAALALLPSNRKAAARREMAWRRANPDIPGFRRLSEKFDPGTGLPLDVSVADLGLRMALVPAADLDMGSERWRGSRPVHTVRVDAFYLARLELTQLQWTAIDGENPSAKKDPALPVHGVSWDDARRWIAKLNDKIAGGGFRLPTEAEWEAAAVRGGAGASARNTWHRENSAAPAKGAFREIDAYSPHPPGRLASDALGLFDMLGNVWEWCSSASRPYPYDAPDGREDATGDELRVLRGGGYADSLADLDPRFRHADRKDRRQIWYGIRVARSVPRP